uniref:Uncharacterized protein n=1 Tax=Oryza brachyantha TaxID=4533 RepID=J3LKP9_ORYBR
HLSTTVYNCQHKHSLNISKGLRQKGTRKEKHGQPQKQLHALCQHGSYCIIFSSQVAIRKQEATAGLSPQIFLSALRYFQGDSIIGTFETSSINLHDTTHKSYHYISWIYTYLAYMLHRCLFVKVCKITLSPG